MAIDLCSSDSDKEMRVGPQSQHEVPTCDKHYGVLALCSQQPFAAVDTRQALVQRVADIFI